MSLFNITFLHDLFPDFKGIHVFSFPHYNLLHYFDSLEISQFLNNLEVGKTFILQPELKVSNDIYDVDLPKIALSEPFIITRDSNCYIISEFLLKQACLAANIYHIKCNETFKIILKYKEINLDGF